MDKTWLVEALKGAILGFLLVAEIALLNNGVAGNALVTPINWYIVAPVELAFAAVILGAIMKYLG